MKMPSVFQELDDQIDDKERREIIEWLDSNEFAADDLIELFWVDGD